MHTEQLPTPGTEALFSVREKSVLITGGSRGIGLMIARGFVAAGAHVFISSRKAEACDAAVHMLTRHLAKTLAPAITVNAIAPGPFISKMTESVFGAGGSHDDLADRVPMRRLGAPEDVAGLAIFLAGPAAAWMTGDIITL